MKLLYRLFLYSSALFFIAFAHLPLKTDLESVQKNDFFPYFKAFLNPCLSTPPPDIITIRSII